MILDERFYANKFDRILYVGGTRYKNIIQDKYNWNILFDVNWIE